MEKNYYVYECYNTDNNYIYYVGKGLERRYKDKWRRNEVWNKYTNNHNHDVRIIKYFGNNEEEAYKYERNRILELKKKNECCANIDDGGRRGGSAIGKRNSQYGISPKERMTDEKYKEWVKHLQDCNGIKNNNYGNKKLSELYKKNPKLSKEKQSRPAEQNGKAKQVDLYDINMNLIEHFNYLGACIKFLEELGIKVNRHQIDISAKTNKPYKNYYFKK